MKPGSTIAFVFFALAFSAAALGLGAAALEGPPTLMSPLQYERLAGAIRAETRIALAACRDVKVGERDVCKASARAAERVGIAELEARYYGTIAAQQEVRAARVRAAYEIERARCLVQPADERVGCLRAARVDRMKSLDSMRPTAG